MAKKSFMNSIKESAVKWGKNMLGGTLNSKKIVLGGGAGVILIKMGLGQVDNHPVLAGVLIGCAALCFCTLIICQTVVDIKGKK